MEAYTELLLWAGEHGVVLNGIEPRRIPGRGIGIVATRALEPGEKLLHVPSAMLRTMDTVPKRISRKLPKKMKIHGLLAADLALNPHPGKYGKWNAVVPSRADIWDSLPLTWDPRLSHEFLPRAARDLLRKQEAKFAVDWAAAEEAFPETPALSRDDYLYAWLLVNSRTFYHETARSLKLPPDDRMVLQPVADLFNHADAGCAVLFSAASFAIMADRAYAAGDEVFICYGNHGNDMLLAEYGFVLASNRWDEACLDDAVLPALSARQRAHLDDRGFLGNYMLDAATVCYRTQVALRLMCVPLREWQRFVDGADDGGKGDDAAAQAKADRLLASLLGKYRETIEKTIDTLGSLQAGQPSQRELLCRRWRQIQTLIDTTITRLES
ncbi:hypothetical protein B0T24DRAFT_374616 [Lasiosphaeria ovina]|uniref:SET domain-containing protein n=1 Tax=Lasiosphaeria ovina TaxID=92902 RepID=A0AAE0N2F8_9PEZI|nr:hypothetical protein B0T24DRAFT_374616 [Lasiosphaeria ovina]